VEGLASKALEVLNNPEDFHALGETGAEMIRTHYSLDQTIPRLAGLFERAMSRKTPAV
jgi:hypothetical protein